MRLPCLTAMRVHIQIEVHNPRHRSVNAACQAIGPKVGVDAESLRRWVLQAQVDAAQRPGATTAEQ
jgi:transposase